MRRSVLACAALMLNACANLNPTLDTVRSLWGSPPPQRVPGFEYLDIRVGGHRTVMALGSRFERDGAWVEQWFSGQGEMLELRDGRIERVLGMTHEVRATQGRPEPWRAWLGANAPPRRWQRERLVMPGYQTRSEDVHSQRMVMPGRPPFADAVWIEEQVSTRQLGGQPWRYTERYALRHGTVVYSEQCVSPDLCFKLQPLEDAP